MKMVNNSLPPIARTVRIPGPLHGRAQKYLASLELRGLKISLTQLICKGLDMAIEARAFGNGWGQDGDLAASAEELDRALEELNDSPTQ